MKRFCLAALCAILLLGTVSCAKKENSPTDTAEPKTTATEDGTSTQKDAVPLPDSEILYDIEAEVGTSDSGPLKAPDAYEVYPISSKEDLDPFRPYFTGLTADKEAKYLGDENGAVFVLEVTSANDFSYYGISSITQTGGYLTVVVSSGEDEFPTPLHTFFLLHIPSGIYQGESLQILFE